jgi:glycolate oxidase iron-sulfur subunit
VKPLSDLAAHCIRCGFCLESCPTFVLTGQETESPRGRIYLARSADEGVLEWDREVKEHIDTCLGCLACTTACPSGVDYEQILEIARDRLEREVPNRAKQSLLKGMTSPRRLRIQLLLGRLYPGRRIPQFLSKWLSGQSPEAELPRMHPNASYPPLDEAALPPVRGEVYLLEGCAMRVLFPNVHAATRRLLRRVGYGVRESGAGCCGALHAHNGFLGEARALAEKLLQAMQDDLPIIVNSAGCGSTMKHYHNLFEEGPERILPRGEEHVGPDAGPGLGPPWAEGWRSRAFDVSEFLLRQGLGEVLSRGRLDAKVAYHDACHLAHGQGVRSEPRALLSSVPGLELVDLQESDMCCGSAGIYNLTEPQLARRLLERKWRNLVATEAEIVALGNPGCHAWIEQAAREHGSTVRVLHTVEVLEEALNPGKST